ncbi:MAG: hypothetical protein U0002_10020 [Thermoanaerobaculia bacterium]
MPIDPKDQWKRKIGRALKKPGNLITGAMSLAASAALWNPLPLILWSLGAGAYALVKAGGDGLDQEMKQEDQAAKAKAAAASREALRQAMEAALSQPPYIDWIRAGQLQDYRTLFRRLVAARDRVASILRERQAQEAFGGMSILDQLDYLLGTYLSFVRERLIYLQILNQFRTEEPQAVAAGERPMVLVKGRSGSRSPVQVPPLPSAIPQPTLEAKLAEIDDKIAALRELAQNEPATAQTREWHIGILEKKRDLLLDCQKRDQYVEAQLAAFPDVFDVIVGRVGASQFSANEMASYMGAVVEQVEESERFVASLKPAMDELAGGVDSGGWMMQARQAG